MFALTTKRHPCEWPSFMIIWPTVSLAFSFSCLKIHLTLTLHHKNSPSGVFAPNIPSHFIYAENCPIVKVCQLKVFHLKVLLDNRLETWTQVKAIGILANQLNIRMLAYSDTSEWSFIRFISNFFKINWGIIVKSAKVSGKSRSVSMLIIKISNLLVKSFL